MHDTHHDPMVIRLKGRKMPEIETAPEVIRKIEEPRVPRSAVVSSRSEMRSVLIVSGLGLLVVALVFLLLWSLHNAREITATHSGTTVTAPTQKAVSTESEIVEKIGKLIVLPTTENPVIATVSNLDALKGQVFFKNAHLGDIVLMYKTASRAILYSPTLNKIIEVAPITGDIQH